MLIVFLLIICLGYLTWRVAAPNSVFSTRQILVALIVLFGIGLYSYFLPGYYIGLNTHSHIGRTWLFKDILEHESTFPIWSNRWYCGFPLGIYYGFLYYLLSAIVSFVFAGDAIFTTKFFLWTLHVGSGISMFFLMRSVTESKLSALFSACFYVFSFQHVGTVLYHARHPIGLIFFLTPILFYCYEQFMKSRMTLYWCSTLLAFLLSLISFTHIQYGGYAVIACFLLAGSRIILNYILVKDRPAIIKQLKLLICTGSLFCIFTAWYFIPNILEAKYLILSSSKPVNYVINIFRPQGFRDISNLIMRSDQVKGNIYYLGLVFLIISPFAYFKKDLRKDVVFQSYLISFFFALAISLFATRFINLWFLFASVLIGFGIQGLFTAIERTSTKASSLLFPILMAVMLIDVGPFLIRTPYNKLKNSKIVELHDHMKKNNETGRIFVLKNKKSTVNKSLGVVNAGASTPFGGIVQTSTKTLSYTAAIASKMAVEVIDRESEPSQSTLDALRLLNVKYVWVREHKKVIAISNSFPAWFATRLKKDSRTSLNLEKGGRQSNHKSYGRRNFDYPYIDYVIAEMHPDKNKPLLNNILLHHSNLSVLDENGLNKEPDFRIRKFSETHHEVHMDYSSTLEGFVWMPYSFFPYNIIEIDGERVQAEKSAMNFVIVPIPQGEHTLAIKASLSPLRKTLILVALLGFFFSLICSIKKVVRN